jgi:cytochrome bd-type quinol oxidase subunit 2
MMSKIKTILAVLSISLLAGATFSPQVSAQTGFEACPDGIQSEVCDNKDQQAEGFASNLIEVLLFVLGIISVIMIIVSGIMYVTSAGSPDKVKKAKDTLTYSVIGLAVALLAYAIVAFVLDRFA